jgi:hypothetical protein
MFALGDQLPVFNNLSRPLAGHALLVKGAFPARADLIDTLHRPKRLGYQLAVVAYRDVAARGGELQRTVDYHLLAGLDAVSLRPADLARQSLGFKVFVTFRAAESETLCYKNSHVRADLEGGWILGFSVAYHHFSQRQYPWKDIQGDHRKNTAQS